MSTITLVAIAVLGLFVAGGAEPVPDSSANGRCATTAAIEINLQQDHRSAVEWARARADANELLRTRPEWPACVPMRMAFAPRLILRDCRSDVQLDILSLDGDVIASTQIGRGNLMAQPSGLWEDRTFGVPQRSQVHDAVRLRWRIVTRDLRGEARLISDPEELRHPAATHSRPVLMEEVPVDDLWNGLSVYLVRSSQHVSCRVKFGGFAPDDVAVGAIVHVFIDGSLAMTFPFHFQEAHRVRRLNNVDLPTPALLFAVPADVAKQIRHDSTVYATVVSSPTIALRDFDRERSAAGGSLVRVEVDARVTISD